MTLSEGDPVLLIDSKGRQFLLKLDPHRSFDFHQGSVPHSQLIGLEDGSWVKSSGGANLLVLRPRLADYVIRMKRGAQIVYPKDLGAILVYGDIGSGMTVVEAGTGSGALTMGLLRAVGPSGKVISVDLREDHSAHARKAITRWLGEIPENLDMRVGDVAEVLDDVTPDRIILDVPEPWRVLPAVANRLIPGGVVGAYLPTVPQVQAIVTAAEELGVFAEIEVKEIFLRDWNVSGRSVRPEHSMVGHTGFLVFMRLVARSE